MNSKKKKLIGAIVALALTVAGYYGVTVPEELGPAITDVACTVAGC